MFLEQQFSMISEGSCDTEYYIIVNVPQNFKLWEMDGILYEHREINGLFQSGFPVGTRKTF